MCQNKASLSCRYLARNTMSLNQEQYTYTPMEAADYDPSWLDVVSPRNILTTSGASDVIKTSLAMCILGLVSTSKACKQVWTSYVHLWWTSGTTRLWLLCSNWLIYYFNICIERRIPIKGSSWIHLHTICAVDLSKILHIIGSLPVESKALIMRDNQPLSSCQYASVLINTGLMTYRDVWSRVSQLVIAFLSHVVIWGR